MPEVQLGGQSAAPEAASFDLELSDGSEKEMAGLEVSEARRARCCRWFSVNV